jgi:hypothetical protein
LQRPSSYPPATWLEGARRPRRRTRRGSTTSVSAGWRAAGVRERARLVAPDCWAHQTVGASILGGRGVWARAAATSITPPLHLLTLLLIHTSFTHTTHGGRCTWARTATTSSRSSSARATPSGDGLFDQYLTSILTSIRPVFEALCEHCDAPLRLATASCVLAAVGRDRLFYTSFTPSLHRLTPPLDLLYTSLRLLYTSLRLFTRPSGGGGPRSRYDLHLIYT